MAGPLRSKTAADNFVELRDRNKLRDGQFSHRNNKPRPQNFDLAIKPGGTVLDLLLIRHAISSARRFTWETAADGGEINFRAHRFFCQTGSLFKPAKERLARRPGKWSGGDWLTHTRRLADDDDATHDRHARDRRRMHSRTAAAVAQPRNVSR